MTTQQRMVMRANFKFSWLLADMAIYNVASGLDIAQFAREWMVGRSSGFYADVRKYRSAINALRAVNAAALDAANDAAPETR